MACIAFKLVKAYYRKQSLFQRANIKEKWKKRLLYIWWREIEDPIMYYEILKMSYITSHHITSHTLSPPNFKLSDEAWKTGELNKYLHFLFVYILLSGSVHMNLDRCQDSFINQSSHTAHDSSISFFLTILLPCFTSRGLWSRVLTWLPSFCSWNRSRGNFL